MSRILGISALTLATHDMSRAVDFYSALGFGIKYGNRESTFTSFHVGDQFLNIIKQPDGREWVWWGRAIFYVEDVDGIHARAVAKGFCPEAPPRDAIWGERYFHITDPDGHELSFAMPLEEPS
ncbi:MAG TPA: glyoxalase [Gammaproteobacteria bacterium]|nr:glyoxalase [Gammaproteobacteria bacterium]|tara:strand:- start:4018 stop:4386 length:369 start_codon:yes stop_codon:yes gene_type:complete